jgi:hypothetical protein
MVDRAPSPPEARGDLPRPTLQFRLRSWRAFQRALDPLAPPKPLRRAEPLEGGVPPEQLEALEEPR